jgi:hypothetical protein
METMTLNEFDSKVIHQADRVNLYHFGYERSGSVKGDPDVYFSCLNRILNGDLVESNYVGFTDDEKKERIRLIQLLEVQLREKEENNKKIQEEIDEKEKDIDRYRKDLLHFRESRLQDGEKLRRENFSTLKFTLNLFLLAMLSVYLFFFYVSATFKALYVDFEGIAAKIAKGEGTGSILPGPYELGEALQYNYLLFVFPFVFYAFGWAFHIILESTNKLRYVFLSALIAVTFTVDFLLAMIISDNTENAKSLMGLQSTPWSQSPTFYIILFLGFLVYIIWSILLDSLLREWNKKEITDNLKKIIRHLQADVKAIKPKISNLEPIKEKIAEYREDISTLMVGNLKRYIDQFSAGWMMYLTPTNMKDIKEKCQAVKREFEERNNIRNGTVKVTNRKLLANLF